MPTPAKIIRSVEEFVKEMTILRDKWFPNEDLVPWCRGQERAEWGLSPKLYRLNPDDDALEIEHEIREEFATRSPALSDYVKLSEDSDLYNWESYFVMQHYGAPTRLLDWTEPSRPSPPAPRVRDLSQALAAREPLLHAIRGELVRLLKRMLVEPLLHPQQRRLSFPRAQPDHGC
jgi:hypothetical protein